MSFIYLVAMTLFMVRLHLRFVFVRHCEFYLSSRNDFIYLFDVVTFFNDVRITFYFDTFELSMEVTLQIRFVFVRNCDVFFIKSQLRYLFVRRIYIFKVR